MRMQNRNTAIAALASSAALATFLTGTPAGAADAPRTTSAPNVSTQRITNLETDTVSILDPYVKLTNGRYRLNAPAAIHQRVGIKKMRDAQRQIDASNALLTARDGADQINKHTLQGSHGWADSTWYGWHIWLDKYVMDKIKNGLGPIGGVAGLMTAIASKNEGDPAYKALLAIIAAGATALTAIVTLCQHENGSGDFYISTLTFPPIFACNPF
ncbi:hypothetical protein GCM10010123_40840 [Pilimelia anulata]|uniref:Secreted protein n=1 Tax=Pilimelia anulata TaxID=53371 RepID=A0A8J3BDI5_9ACTN|nr:hypothetical protein [Pilimelia anulata]GGK06902.1 hypothetical protein GCM10010123_40840 [Pilimelia anulata]